MRTSNILTTRTHMLFYLSLQLLLTLLVNTLDNALTVIDTITRKKSTKKFILNNKVIQHGHVRRTHCKHLVGQASILTSLIPSTCSYTTLGPEYARLQIRLMYIQRVSFFIPKSYYDLTSCSSSFPQPSPSSSCSPSNVHWIFLFWLLLPYYL